MRLLNQRFQNIVKVDIIYMRKFRISNNKKSTTLENSE